MCRFLVFIQKIAAPGSCMVLMKNNVNVHFSAIVGAKEPWYWMGRANLEQGLVSSFIEFYEKVL
jgi:hypothetical protein